ncbi:carotenoid biosynthesis protein [Ilumatobacter sp.]|uniref:carotenoid biosynthesis protein n=1 Tax=Ilumatobacter sp. TaxID=1967498 RepID=UPI003B51E349
MSDTASSATARALGPISAVAATVTVAGMIATPLAPARSPRRRVLSSVVVGAMSALTTANAARRWGPRRALGAAAVTAGVTGVVERFGTATGFPFGRYDYSAALRPQLAHVPVIVPLAWFAMGVPSREAAHAALGESSSTAGRVALGAAAMTAWDLFLDPQMVAEGYWSWQRRGRYRGIPVSNYLGWFLTSAALMALFERLLPVARAGSTDPPAGTERAPASAAAPVSAGAADVRLVGQYGYVSVMQTVGFARFFRDPLVAAVGGAAMLPTSIAAARRVLIGRGVHR